jgi:thioredoxin-like negative regulator of GroEL
MSKIFSVLCLFTLVVFFTGCSQSQSLNSNNSNSSEQEVLQPEQVVDSPNIQVSNLTDEEIALKYFEATESDVKQKLVGQYKFALFFFADWSKTCLDMETEIKDALDQLPQDTVIAKVNFDDELNLRSQYGVTLESTVLVFDEKGTLLETLVSPNLEQILTSLN